MGGGEIHFRLIALEQLVNCQLIVLAQLVGKHTPRKHVFDEHIPEFEFGTRNFLIQKVLKKSSLMAANEQKLTTVGFIIQVADELTDTSLSWHKSYYIKNMDKSPIAPKYDSPLCLENVKENDQVILFLVYHQELKYWCISAQGGILDKIAEKDVEKLLFENSINRLRDFENLE